MIQDPGEQYNIYQRKIDVAKQKDCQEALKIDPEYEAAIFSLAYGYKQLKKYDEAISGYNRLIELDRRDYKPHLNLGEIYLEMKYLDKAIPCFQKAIALEADRSAVAHNLLGKAYLEKKMIILAEKEIKIALELRPGIQCCPNVEIEKSSNFINFSIIERKSTVIDLKANFDFWSCNFNNFNINFYNSGLMGHYCPASQMPIIIWRLFMKRGENLMGL